MLNLNNDNGKVAVEYRPLKSRFYILLTFSLYNLLCGFLWNSWTPIMVSISELYHWSLTETNLQANLFSITFILFIAPIVYLWNKKGIQLIYKLSAILIVFGTVIRLYPSSIFIQSVLIQIGSAITGVGAVISLVAPPVISMIWFPSGERARATATSLSFNTLGSAISPITASHLVPVASGKVNTNSTIGIEVGIQKYMFFESTMAIIVLIMILIYFPSKPSISPCKSSENALRLEFWCGTKMLIKNKQFWIAFAVTLITFGFNSTMPAVAVTYIIPMGISQKQAGLISFISNVLSFFSCLFGGWLGDKLRYKTIILASVPPTVILYTVTGLQCLDVIPHDLLSIYISSIIQSIFTNFAAPASFEMGVETAFPVSEEISTAAIALATNIGGLLYLSVGMIPNIGTTWIPFSYAFFSFLLVPLMWFYKDQRNRMNCDAILADGDVLPVNNCPYDLVSDEK